MVGLVVEKKSRGRRKKVAADKPVRGGIRLDDQGNVVNGAPGRARPTTRKDPNETRDYKGFFRFGDSLLVRLKDQGYDPDRRGAGPDGRSNSDILLELVTEALAAREASTSTKAS